ncbi:hypothetical protein EV215_2013, partial [Hypnocyclicus thermotrophus]
YKIEPLLRFIEEEEAEMKEKLKWGYNTAYMLTGQLNEHPRAAINFVKEERKDYTKFYEEVI